MEAKILEIGKSLGITGTKTNDNDKEIVDENVVGVKRKAEEEVPAAKVPLPKAPAPIRCYCCGHREQLVPFHDVHICGGCKFDLHTGYFNREKVLKYYGFSKAKADKIPRKTLRGRRNVFYSYSIRTVESAFRKEHSQTKTSLRVLASKGRYYV